MSVFLYSRWMALPLTTKALLAKEFGFAKTGPTHVADNRVVADGYKVDDVENAMDIEAIRRYVGESIADYDALWQAMIDKVEGRTPITVARVIEVKMTAEAPVTIEALQNGGLIIDEVGPPAEVSKPKKRGQPSKK